MFNVATLQQLKQVTGQPRPIASGNRFISWQEELQSRVLGEESRVAILAIDGCMQTIFQSHTRGLAFANNLCPKTRQSLFFYQGRHCRSARMVCLAVCFYFCLFPMYVFLLGREKNSPELSAMLMKTSWGEGPCQRPWNLLGTISRDWDGHLRHWKVIFPS